SLASTTSGCRPAIASTSGFLVPRTRVTTRSAGSVHQSVAPTSSPGAVTATDSVSDGTRETTRATSAGTSTGVPWSSDVGDTDPGVGFVTAVDRDEVRGQRLDLVGVAQPSGVDPAKPGNPGG